MERLKTFLTQPYRAEMSALDWFLFIGLLLVIMIAWRFILSHLKEA